MTIKKFSIQKRAITRTHRCSQSKTTIIDPGGFYLRWGSIVLIIVFDWGSINSEVVFKSGVLFKSMLYAAGAGVMKAIALKF